MSTRSQLIQRLVNKNPEILSEDMEYVVSECFEYLASSLASSDRVEIRGFGSFEVREKKVVSSLSQNNGSIRKVVHYKSSSLFKD